MRHHCSVYHHHYVEFDEVIKQNNNQYVWNGITCHRMMALLMSCYVPLLNNRFTPSGIQSKQYQHCDSKFHILLSYIHKHHTSYNITACGICILFNEYKNCAFISCHIEINVEASLLFISSYPNSIGISFYYDSIPALRKPQQYFVHVMELSQLLWHFKMWKMLTLSFQILM